MEGFRIDLKTFLGLSILSTCQNVNIKLVLEGPESLNFHDPYNHTVR